MLISAFETAFRMSAFCIMTTKYWSISKRLADLCKGREDLHLNTKSQAMLLSQILLIMLYVVTLICIRPKLAYKDNGNKSLKMEKT